MTLLQRCLDANNNNVETTSSAYWELCWRCKHETSELFTIYLLLTINSITFQKSFVSPLLRIPIFRSCYPMEKCSILSLPYWIFNLFSSLPCGISAISYLASIESYYVSTLWIFYLTLPYTLWKFDYPQAKTPGISEFLRFNTLFI